MYFREKKTSRTPVLQLVETKRTREGKVSQRVVVSLGGCRVPDELRKAVAVEVTQRAAGYQRILDTEPDSAHWTERVLEKMEEAGRLPKPKRVEVADQGDKPFERVCCEDVEHEESTELGPYLVMRRAWESLGLDAVLKDRDFSDDQLAAAQVSVFNRLVEPVSENERPNWARRPRPVLCMGRAPTARGETGHRNASPSGTPGVPAPSTPARRESRPLMDRDHFGPHRNGTALSFPPSPIFLSPIFLSNPFPLSFPHGIIPVFQRLSSAAVLRPLK